VTESDFYTNHSSHIRNAKQSVILIHETWKCGRQTPHTLKKAMNSRSDIAAV